jgi:hypothetical protein
MRLDHAELDHHRYLDLAHPLIIVDDHLPAIG